jgi:putative ABC transport system substrate-binding protein
MMIRRAGIVAAVALCLLAAPTAGVPQPAGKVARVGILAAGSAAEAPNIAFLDKMRELGYVEGRTVVYERRFAAGKIERLPTLAAQLVTTRPDVIFAPVTPAALAARAATRTIPIVFAVSADPVGAGLITSLRQPGGNVTGLASMNTELVAKRMQLLKEAAPRISRIAILLNPDNVPDRQQLNALNEVAPKLGLAVMPIAVRTADDYEPGFADARAKSADALMIIPNPLNIQSRSKIVDFAVRGRLPTIDAEDRGARMGALMSYGPSWVESFRQAAGLVDRILKGAEARDLPVEQPTKFELVINLKTAKALGLTIPQSLLVRADQLIE